jgi:glycosyltransferase involved in cell wall biosynthesis
LSSGAVQGLKRVAFLIAYLHKGGMQKAVSNISCALPSHFEQYVVFFGTEDPGFEYHGKMVNLDVPGNVKSGLLRKAANSLRRKQRLQQFIDAHEIDTVVSFGEAANILNCLTKRKRTVLSVRVSIAEGLAETGRSAAIYRSMVRRLYRSADKVIAVSEALACQLTSVYDVPRSLIQVIYNLYDIDKIQDLSAEPPPPAAARIFDDPTVINVGSLVYQKGQEFLIRGFALARQKAPDLRLAIVGQGELQGRLEKIAAELGVAGAVHFLGFDPNPYRYLSRSRVFALTSRFEGFPNVLAEAMICGLPVIATDCKTGPSEILGDSEYGILLPDITEKNASQVEREIASSIIRLLQPECARRYSGLASLRASHFSKDRLIQNWVEVL